MLSYIAEYDRRLRRQTVRRYGLDRPDANWARVMQNCACGGRTAALGLMTLSQFSC